MIHDKQHTRRSHHTKRTWVVDCSICHRWSSVPTLEMQTLCREAGVCLECMSNDYYVLRTRIVAIEMVLESLAARGKQMPEDRRVFLRKIYVRKVKQLADARAQLESLRVTK